MSPSVMIMRYNSSLDLVLIATSVTVNLFFSSSIKLIFKTSNKFDIKIINYFKENKKFININLKSYKDLAKTHINFGKVNFVEYIKLAQI